jgi:hypothetical protein
MFSFIENWVFLTEKNKIVSYTFGIAENLCIGSGVQFIVWRTQTQGMLFVMYAMLSLLVQSI